MRLNAYEAFLTNIRCIGIGAATFRPTGPRPKKHGGVIGQKGGHVTVTSPVQMKIHWKSWHITEIGMTPPWSPSGLGRRRFPSTMRLVKIYAMGFGLLRPARPRKSLIYFRWFQAGSRGKQQTVGSACDVVIGDGTGGTVPLCRPSYVRDFSTDPMSIAWKECGQKLVSPPLHWAEPRPWAEPFRRQWIHWWTRSANESDISNQVPSFFTYDYSA